MSISVLEREIDKPFIETQAVDKEKFRTYIEESVAYYDYIKKQAKKLTKNKFDAEDLTQDTYLKVLEKIGLYKDQKRMRQWIERIMRNTFINNHHKKRRILPHQEISSIERKLGVFPKEASDIIFSQDKDYLETVKDHIQDETYVLLRSIPKIYRNALIVIHFQNFFQDLEYNDVSFMLSIPIGTAKSRLSRARAFFKRNYFV